MEMKSARQCSQNVFKKILKSKFNISLFLLLHVLPRNFIVYSVYMNRPSTGVFFLVERPLHSRVDHVHVVLGQGAVGRGQYFCEKLLMCPTTRGTVVR